MKGIVLAGDSAGKTKVAVLNSTFKENCPDVRNTRVIDIIDELKEYTRNILVWDPQADPADVKHEYGIELSPLDEVKDATALIVAGAHDEFKQLSVDQLLGMMDHVKLLVDVKNTFDKKELEAEGVKVWRL